MIVDNRSHYYHSLSAEDKDPYDRHYITDVSMRKAINFAVEDLHKLVIIHRLDFSIFQVSSNVASKASAT